MTNERELSQALSAGLAGQSLYRWGWAALESDQAPPSLPLVTLVRLSADVAAIDSMCRQVPDMRAEITVETHLWHEFYENARTLQETVRAIVAPTGWRLQGEQDTYDALIKAWRISAQWAAVGPINGNT